MLQHAPRGAHNPRWKGGITPVNAALRHSAQYLEWRRRVFERDNYTCQRCGDDVGGNLHAHHIKPFSNYPELRFIVSNGVTLCELCHWKEHSRPVSDETIYLIEVAMQYAFDLFGSARALARAFNVSPRTVRKIVAREGNFAS